MMIDHVQLIENVPDEVFGPTLKEVEEIDIWDKMPQTRGSTQDGMVGQGNKKQHVFGSCQTIHLRYHKIPAGMAKSVHEHSKVIECADTQARVLFPHVNKLVDWIYQTVKGKRLGQIMLAKLLPESGIPYHRDPGPYWEVYKRFHVPIITNPMVLFYCRHNDKEIHMKSGNLYQLNNLWLHAAENYSPYERIHVIVDIETDDECFAIEDEPEWLKNLPSGAY